MELAKFEVQGVEKFGTPKLEKCFDGVRAEFQFANGWGASVIRHSGSCGGRNGLWELAVIDASGELHNDTPVTGDVLGWQTDDEILALLDNIKLMAPEGTETVAGELLD